MRSIGAVLTAGVLLLAGCGGGDDGDDVATSDTGETSPAETAEESAAEEDTAEESTSDDGSGGEQAASGPVAAVIKGLDNPFFGAMADGIEDEADADGIEVEVQAAASLDDLTGQADNLATLAGQDFECYVLNPISETNLVQPLAQLAEQDVPVVNIDLPISREAAQEVGAEIATYIGTDNVAAGRTGGEFMTETLGGEGSVALIGGIEGDPTSQARLDGFQDGLADGIQVVTTVAGDWDRETALTQAETILNDTPDLGGFFAANDVMALGIAQAVANAGLTGEVAVLGVDGIQDALDAVEDGRLTGTVSQYPYVIGQLGVDACLAATAGEDLPENVDAPVQLVTEDNVAQAQENFPEPPSPYDNPFEQ